MGNNLSRVEQETILSFNAAEQTLNICTTDPVQMRHLDDLCTRQPNAYKFVREIQGTRYYETSKNLLSLRTPRVLTDEQRAAVAERFKQYRAAKANES